MKKILSLCLALSAVFATEADAQWRKTWDFTKGLSAETQQNLIADEANWSITYQDDGVSVKEAKDLTKMSGELMANGKPSRNCADSRSARRALTRTTTTS